jgi:hypothetical protein
MAKRLTSAQKVLRSVIKTARKSIGLPATRRRPPKKK